MSKRYPAVLALAVFSAGAAAQPLPMNDVFAAGKRGEYLAGVDVVLTDRDGKRSAVKFTAEAPICLIEAPAGRYRVEAVSKDVKRAMDTRVAKDAKQPGMLVFRFPGHE